MIGSQLLVLLVLWMYRFRLQRILDRSRLLFDAVVYSSVLQGLLHQLYFQTFFSLVCIVWKDLQSVAV